jgi:hypothetical protein
LKIINVDDKPYEFTWDGCHFGPIAPGQIADYPNEVAQHAIKRGVVTDEIGNFVRLRVDSIENVDPSLIRDIAIYDCPLQSSGQCDAGPFKTVDDLKAHLESHWELSEGASPTIKKGGASAYPRKQ